MKKSQMFSKEQRKTLTRLIQNSRKLITPSALQAQRQRASMMSYADVRTQMSSVMSSAQTKEKK